MDVLYSDNFIKISVYVCLCRHGDGCMVGCGLEPSGGQLSDNLWCAALSNAMKLWSYV